MKAPKNFFIISFIPALAYWYLEENYSIQIALIGGLILATIEVVVEKIFFKHIHTISKLNFFLIAVLGGVALIAQDGLLFKLQPFFTGFFISGFLFWRLWKGQGLMTQMSQQLSPNQSLPSEILNFIERNMAIFLLIYGCFMAYVAIRLDTQQWLFFKTFGFYIATFIFVIIQVILIKKKSYDS